eukprot:scaffold368_cov258-Pinguiococcus_pyrenoidosus.AAC.27
MPEKRNPSESSSLFCFVSGLSEDKQSPTQGSAHITPRHRGFDGRDTYSNSNGILHARAFAEVLDLRSRPRSELRPLHFFKRGTAAIGKISHELGPSTDFGWLLPTGDECKATCHVTAITSTSKSMAHIPDERQGHSADGILLPHLIRRIRPHGDHDGSGEEEQGAVHARRQAGLPPVDEVVGSYKLGLRLVGD